MDQINISFILSASAAREQGIIIILRNIQQHTGLSQDQSLSNVFYKILN